MMSLLLVGDRQNPGVDRGPGTEFATQVANTLLNCKSPLTNHLRYFNQPVRPIAAEPQPNELAKTRSSRRNGVGVHSPTPRRNAMLSFLTKFAALVRGVLSGLDRLFLRGTLRGLSHPNGLERYVRPQRIAY